MFEGKSLRLETSNQSFTIYEASMSNRLDGAMTCS